MPESKLGRRGMFAGLPVFKKALLFLAPVAFVSAGWGGPLLYLNSQDPIATNTTPAETNGHTLYLKHCAYCHGPTGNGQGPASLLPPPRAFGYEKYKFASTTNGNPTDEDFQRILKHGIPGSAMPAFEYLSEVQVAAITDHVRGLAKQGTFRFKWDRTMKAGDDPDAGEITAMLPELNKVIEPIAVPKLAPESSSESIARGKVLFTKNCANCHGPEGKGDGPQVKDPKFLNENGTPAQPRDLTQEAFKGGREKHQVYKRIFLGIPGTPMPATNTLKPEEYQDLIDYVLSLNQGTK